MEIATANTLCSHFPLLITAFMFSISNDYISVNLPRVGCMVSRGLFINVSAVRKMSLMNHDCDMMLIPQVDKNKVTTMK